MSGKVTVGCGLLIALLLVIMMGVVHMLFMGVQRQVRITITRPLQVMMVAVSLTIVQTQVLDLT